LENVRAYAETGVNFISVGTITHSAKAADMSMRLAPV
jgi:nicotinate-nucleotide pyrophosphorylase (carboxylating)